MSFGGLYTSISGLQASKQSLNTVGHNISNANNPNYVRQSAIHSNNPYRKIGDGRMEIGTGVNVIQIRQIRDEFLDKQIRQELPSFGYYYSKFNTLTDVQEVFGEINGIEESGLRNIMGDFWDSWDELFKVPDSLTIRGIVHESAVAFTETVNHQSSQLNNIQRNLNIEMLNKVKEVNSLLEGIAKINKGVKLVEGEKSKMKANDLRDERNAMIDRLSELVPVKTNENAFGETMVSLQGRDLVSGSYISKIDIQNDEKGFGHIYWEKSSEKIELGTKGELAGIIDVRDNSIEEYKERLDMLVGKMADEINAVHVGGYGLKENPTSTPPTGNPFFTSSGAGPITAASIRVNPDLADYNKIAASASGEIGDGEIAKKIYEIRGKIEISKYSDSSKNMNLDEYYNDLITSLALETEEAESISASQGFLIKSIDEKRIGLSAVSLDEEMADMIKFQHAYSANARVINTLDEMIDTIVNRLGIVGR